MLPHWNSVIRPFLEALDAGPIIEIGAFEGDTTMAVAQFATEHDITLHVIDPDPKFNIQELQDRFGGNFCFYKAKSHTILEHVEPAAVALIDGDHNWYSVHGELERMAKIAAFNDAPFPLVIFHDVEWPYARRDMYWDPDAIPEEWRNPWSRGGIEWGKRTLTDSDKGLNHGMAHAIDEGGPRNGVLTAIEDFVEETATPMELQIVHGDHGIGILVSNELLDSNLEVLKQWKRLRSADFLIEQTRRLSEIAAMESTARKQAVLEADLLRRELEEANHKLASTQRMNAKETL